ncbi:MAG TPA: hypothetical protein VH092_21710 [Urbifossiella sp.]|jgi:hypothetical protein|nr:hypothetical protein [Urbifossiella sp.]
MEPFELRDLDAARRFVAEGLWLQRAVKPTAATVRPALEWALEVAGGGHPLPPIGFVADLGHVALGADADHRPKEPLLVPGWPPTLARQYEDHVLGKLYADWAFERAGDAVRALVGPDRTRGVAYLVNQVRDRAGAGGVLLPPAVIRHLLSANPDELLARAWDDLSRDGPTDLNKHLVTDLVAAGRRLSEVLVKEDIAALEDRSALGDMGQYVALRQIRQITARLLARLPARPVRPLTGRKEVPTRIMDEDQYPVGGYTSISPRGSIESLLHSQLAFMESDSSREPDLFDVRFARDELFYYSRDENQFLRRRRVFAFVLLPDLVSARFKDPDLPVQRIVLVQSAVLAAITKLTDWLSTDAIRFEVLFVQDGERKPLADEAGLFELLLRESIARGDAAVMHLPDRAAAARRLADHARKAQVHALVIGAKSMTLPVEVAVVNGLVVNGPRPSLRADDTTVILEAEDALEQWQETVLRLLQLWV